MRMYRHIDIATCGAICAIMRVMEKPKPPSGLRASGKRLWNEVLAVYELNPLELVLLEEACHTTDEIDQMERVLRGLDSLLVPGYMGMPKPHPLLAELRAHTLLLLSLIKSLRLPDVAAHERVRKPSKPAPQTNVRRLPRKPA
jgi:hypothetical protein